MSYKWPGIPNGDYSFDHGRAVWNKIINYLRRLSEKLDVDIVDATADRRGMMTAADKAALDAIPDIYAVRSGALTDNPITRTSATGVTAVISQGIASAGANRGEIFDIGWDPVGPNGAFLGLRSCNHSTQPGWFYLGAKDAQNASALIGTPTGQLTWGGSSVVTVSALVAGNNVTITYDSEGRTVTFDATDTVYTHPTYTARTGKPTANQTPGFGDTVTVSQIESDSTGHVTAATDRTITIPNTAASATSAGLVTTGTQTFAGAKLFNNSVETNSYMRVWTRALDGEASRWNELSFYSRENSLRLGMLRATDYADGRHYLQLTATNTNPNDPSQTIWATISLTALPDGTVYVTAPTPAQTDDSTKIATTAYVKDCVPTSVGSATTPVFSNANGVITACTYELKKTVPADAVFTDHTYSAATQSTDGLMSAGDKTKLDGIDLTPYALLNSPAFTGTPTAPTPTTEDNSTKIATTAFVNNRLPYTTGTWTPTLYGKTTAGSTTITSNSCTYVKVGHMVIVNVKFSFEVVTAPTGQVRVGGLPYTSNRESYGLFWSSGHGGHILTASGSVMYIRNIDSNGIPHLIGWGTNLPAWDNTVSSTGSIEGTVVYYTTA